MGNLNRREFLVGASGALAAGGLLHAAPSSLAIAHYKAPATAQDAIAEEARRLTRAAVDALGGMRRFVSKGQKVWIKPNIGWDRRPEQAACTNPDVVATIVQMCYQAGASKVFVSDNPCVTPEKSFARSGIQAAAQKAGAECYYMDDRKFRRMAIKGSRILKEWPVYSEIVESDRLINIGIVKHHSMSRAALGMKNLMGATGGARDRFHQNIGQSLVDIAAFLKPQLVVLDAVRILTANGPTGGNLADVKRKDTIIAGVDQVAVDAYGATLLGLKPTDIACCTEGQARGLGTMNYQSLSPAMLEI